MPAPAPALAKEAEKADGNKQGTAWFQECPEWLRPIVGLAVTTGMRRSEILILRWLDVDMAHRCVLLPQTKNGEGRIVYLNESAAAALNSLPFTEGTRTTDRLFAGISPAKVSVAFGRACNRTKTGDYRFHDTPQPVG